VNGLRKTTIGACVLAIGLAAAGAYVAIDSGLGPLPDPENCTATVEGHSVSLTLEQAENASIIAAVAERRGLPARAVTIAIATAYQESKLRNLDEGDRDSLGLFQQRPSQGWGSPTQVTDPYYATNAFYDALVSIDGYQDMEITDAAQQVQRSAFPNAYADHEEDGRAIASALSGYSRAAFTCTVDAPEESSQSEGQDGLTGRAQAVRHDVERAFGPLPLGGFVDGGVTSAHLPGSAHDEGRAIDIFFRPISAENKRRGWVVAHYLVANADRLDVAHVIFDDRIWTAGSQSEEGWRDFNAPDVEGADAAARAILEHRDHVHVVVS
jgi:hypothetical protein